MKAQRRHELKINSLDDALGKLHARWRHYAVWGVTTVLVSVLVGLLVHNRITAAQQRAFRAADDMAVVRGLIDEIRIFAAQDRDLGESADLYREINARIDSILAAVSDGNPRLAAEALMARGDASWYMRAAITSTTQPASSHPGLTPTDLERTAQTAYERVLTGYPSQHFAVASAHFGLAAIDENQHDWDAARKQYQTIADDPQSGDVFSLLAKQMLTSVDTLQRPPLIGQVVAPTTEPTTEPTTFKY